MRVIFSFLALLLCPWVLAIQELVAPRVTVLYDDPALAGYAQQVATAAEAALDILTQLFETEPPRITLDIDASTDVFNAVAPPLPRPKVALRALFPLGGEFGFRAEDPLFLLLLHELTHSVQLTYTELPEDDASVSLLDLVGEGVAVVPPSWFLEGLATYVESEFTSGGRRDDARTKGILETMALAGRWPNLDDAGLITHGAWPGGDTRYLFGAGFVDYLVREHGFEVVRETLKDYNAGLYTRSFADAWQRVGGTNLFEAWEAWHQEVLSTAQRREIAVGVAEASALTSSGWWTRAPAVSPDGRRLAWVSSPPAISVAELEQDGLGQRKIVLSGRFPRTLDWLDDDTLVYARPLRTPGREASELFLLEVDTGREIQLTRGARAHFPRADPEGCILFVRDVVPEGSSLRRLCSGEATQREELVWQAPAGQHIVGLAVSEAGRVALSLWSAGWTDLALLEEGVVRYLTRDRAQDLDPFWRDEQTLIFGSDREDVFDIYAVASDQPGVTRLTESIGGAFQAVSTKSQLLYLELFSTGYDLVGRELALPSRGGASLPVERPLNPSRSLALGAVPLVENEAAAEPAFEVRRYSPLPSLTPYLVLPGVVFDAAGVAASVSLLGQDDSGEHSYTLKIGYDDLLSGHLSGAEASLRYDFRANTLLNSFQRRFPLGFGLQAGIWPHDPHRAVRTETALGVEFSVTATLPFDRWASLARLEVGVLHLQSFNGLQLDGRVDGVISRQFRDSFGYRTRGPRFGASAVWSATATGPVTGVWFDTSYYWPLAGVSLPGHAELALRFGLRPASPIPLSLGDGTGVATFGYRYSWSARLRYRDGLYAVERLTFEPRARTWFDGSWGVGTDLSVFADAVLAYGAPVSIGGTVGYAQGWWYRLGARLPL
jgi:hypothetical protein